MIKLLVKNTSLNLVGYIYLLLMSLISVPMLTRGLGEQMFAQYLLLAAIPPFFSVFDLGISQAVIRALSLGKDTARIETASLGYFLVNAIILAVIAFVVVAFIETSSLFAGSQLHTLTLLVLSACVLINQVLTHFSSLAQADSRFDIFNYKTFIVGTGNTLIAGFVALQSGDLLPIFAALLVSYILALGATYYSLCQYRQVNLVPAFHRATVHGLMDYGLKGFAGRVSGQVELHASKLILAQSLSGLAVSAFAIPQMLMYRAAGAISQGTLALSPLTSRLIAPEYRGRLRTLYYRLQGGLVGLALVGVLLAHTHGEPFLMWWLTDKGLVEAIIPVLRILSYFFVLLSLTPVASTVVDSLGYPHYTSISAVATSILNLIFLLILTPKYGARGAAYALFIAFALTTPIYLYVTERLLQANKLQY